MPIKIIEAWRGWVSCLPRFKFPWVAWDSNLGLSAQFVLVPLHLDIQTVSPHLSPCWEIWGAYFFLSGSGGFPCF